MEIPRNYNPADFYIQKLAIYPKTREENLAQIEVKISFGIFILQMNFREFVMHMKNLLNVLVMYQK
jgi:hypothetical protein